MKDFLLWVVSIFLSAQTFMLTWIQTSINTRPTSKSSQQTVEKAGAKIWSFYKNSLTPNWFCLCLSLCNCLTYISTCLPVHAHRVLLIIISDNLDALSVRLFWRADSLRPIKSNIPLYLFNNSDLLYSSYLLVSYLPTLSPFIYPSVTLIKSVTSLPPV